jgi:hypothetical protein
MSMMQSQGGSIGAMTQGQQGKGGLSDSKTQKGMQLGQMLFDSMASSKYARNIKETNKVVKAVQSGNFQKSVVSVLEMIGAIDAMTMIMEGLLSPLTLVKAQFMRFAGEALDPIYEAMQPIFDWIDEKWGPVFEMAGEKLGTFLARIINIFTGDFDWYATPVQDWIQANIFQGAESVQEWMEQNANTLEEQVNLFLWNWIHQRMGGVGSLLSVIMQTPNIGFFQEGGTVLPRPGGTLGVLGEGGEEEHVIPGSALAELQSTMDDIMFTLRRMEKNERGLDW